MCRIVFLLSLMLLSAPCALAQVVSPPAPPVNQEGMRSFCIYANELFSLGAQLCVPNSNAGMRCVPSEGTKSDGRAFWSYDSKEWPIAPGLQCGGGR
jgi:hypothetical protein